VAVEMIVTDWLNGCLYTFINRSFFMNGDEFETFIGEDGAAEFMGMVYADVY
jgi:hypothetical protein